jgi:signal transduction histidine kinase
MPNVHRQSEHDMRLNEADDARVMLRNVSSDQRSAAAHSARAVQRLSVLGEMTAGIAHDFRNILAIIDSGLRLAERNSSDAAAMITFIAGAREGVARGLRLTSRLLTFAQQREIPAPATDVNELLKALELFFRYAAGSEVRVFVELNPDVPECLVDSVQFSAAMLNLFINARDAMPKGGEVRISTAPRVTERDARDGTPVAYVRVRVQDNGSGMSEEVIEKLFQPFFTTKGQQGTGLGLPQVGAFVRGMGGHVRITSDLGQGTTFDLYLPAVPNGARPGRMNVEPTALHS